MGRPSLWHGWLCDVAMRSRHSRQQQSVARFCSEWACTLRSCGACAGLPCGQHGRGHGRAFCFGRCPGALSDKRDKLVLRLHPCACCVRGGVLEEGAVSPVPSACNPLPQQSPRLNKACSMRALMNGHGTCAGPPSAWSRCAHTLASSRYQAAVHCTQPANSTPATTTPNPDPPTTPPDTHTHTNGTCAGHLQAGRGV